jgi:hypothetical protein
MAVQLYPGNGKLYFQIVKKLEASNLSKEDQDLICHEIERLALENQKAQIVLKNLHDEYEKITGFIEHNFKK